jgi:hypothetical protein
LCQEYPIVKTYNGVKLAINVANTLLQSKWFVEFSARDKSRERFFTVMKHGITFNFLHFRQLFCTLKICV